MDVTDKVVAVTGAASGIGLATVNALAAGGAKLGLIDLDGDNVSRVAESLPSSAIALPADVSSSADIAAAFDRIMADFGRVDGFVGSAGIPMPEYLRVVDLADDDWDRVIRVNLRGMFITCREAARRMRDRGGGSIVAVSSISGHAPRLGQSAYGSSKAGVIQLCRVLALELAEAGIRVNAICPGIVNTPLMKHSREQLGEEVVNRKIYGHLPDFRAGIPLRRYAEPEDVAATALFLLSDAARHITGQSVFVDGGESLV